MYVQIPYPREPTISSLLTKFNHFDVGLKDICHTKYFERYLSYEISIRDICDMKFRYNQINAFWWVNFFVLECNFPDYIKLENLSKE